MLQGKAIVARAIGGSKAKRLPTAEPLASSATVDACEPRVVRLGFFTGSGFGFPLRVRHSLLYPVENFPFGEAGIFQDRYSTDGHRRYVLQPSLEEQLYGGVRQTDDVKHDRVAADGVQLIGLCDFQNLRLREIRASKILHGIRGYERVLMLVGDTNQRDYGVLI